MGEKITTKLEPQPGLSMEISVNIKKCAQSALNISDHGGTNVPLGGDSELLGLKNLSLYTIVN